MTNPFSAAFIRVVNNKYKVAACFIVALLFAIVPALAYITLLIAAAEIAAAFGLATKIVWGITVVFVWGIFLAPFALKMSTFQFMVGFAEAAKFLNLRDVTRDSDGNAIPTEASK